MLTDGGMMNRRPREVILAARISFYRFEENQSGYRDKVEFKNLEAPRDHLEREVRRTIESDLPAELEAIYGLRVRTRFITTRPGSVIAFFAVVVEALGIFSSYSDFFESISLVRKHSAALLERLMEERYTPGPSLTSDVSVTVEYPRVPDPDDLHPGRRFWKRFGPEADMMFAAGWSGSQPRVRRDGLFWWLVICNLLFAVALGALVAAAVVRTYFTVERGLPGGFHKSSGAAEPAAASERIQN